MPAACGFGDHYGGAECVSWHDGPDPTLTAPIPAFTRVCFESVVFDQNSTPSDAPEAAEPRVAAVRILAGMPNPFHGATRIDYEIAVAGRVRLEIYDTSGRLVRRLRNELQVAGRHEATWDGRDQLGHEVATGVYFAVLRGSGASTSRRLILLR